MKRPRRCSLQVEQLESRFLPALLSGTDLGVAFDGGSQSSDFHPVIVAGDPSGSPADSPANRVDPNEPGSPFAGVGTLRIQARKGLFLCTATAIDATHVLAAAHCVDINNNGRPDKGDGIVSIQFFLNLDTDTPDDHVDAAITASSWKLHPDYTGFGRPSVNDDLSVITLSSPIPAGVPAYGLFTGNLSGQTLTMVGYGRSGDGVNGYTTEASFLIKRTGQNVANAFLGQDDAGRPAANEVFRFDFDGPSGNGTFGGATLGNDKETTFGPGDSGGPSFVLVGTTYVLAGVNTFTEGAAPLFGSLGGGMALPAYAAWINSLLGGGASSRGSGGNGSGGGSPALAEVVASLLAGSAIAAAQLETHSAPAENSPDQDATVAVFSTMADELSKPWTLPEPQTGFESEANQTEHPAHEPVDLDWALAGWALGNVF